MDSLKIKGLSLSRAVSSGHPYKHKSWDKFYTGKVTGCTTGEALSDEWEIDPPDLFTRKQVILALQNAIQMTVANAQHNSSFDLEGAQEEHLIADVLRIAANSPR